MNDEPGLGRLLHRLAAESPREAGSSTEQHVLAAFRGHHKRGRRRAFYAAIAAACLAIVIVSVRAHRVARHAATPPASITSGFIPLPYAQSDVPLEQAVIVRVDLQPSAWSALNVPAPALTAGAVIRADLLIGQDGVARAVRVVNVH
jgi:hypothetical protein